MTNTWMWNDNGEVWSLYLDRDTGKLEWSDSIGCACSSSFAEQTIEDFADNGPRYGNLPAHILTEVQTALAQISSKVM